MKPGRRQVASGRAEGGIHLPTLRNLPANLAYENVDRPSTSPNTVHSAVHFALLGRFRCTISLGLTPPSEKTPP